MRTEARLTREVSDELEAAGLRARIVVRDLDSQAEISIAPDGPVPLASVVKVPIALAVLNRIAAGQLEADRQVLVEPGRFGSVSPMATSRFRHPARIAVDDLDRKSVV